MLKKIDFEEFRSLMQSEWRDDEIKALWNFCCAYEEDFCDETEIVYETAHAFHGMYELLTDEEIFAETGFDSDELDFAVSFYMRSNAYVGRTGRGHLIARFVMQ